MSYYLKEGDLLWPQTEVGVQNRLSAGTYTVGASMKGFFLKPVTNFKIQGKIYGSATRHANRILSTFESRPHATGVLLNGDKGSGKTMLAKRVSELALSQGIPTIIVDSQLSGAGFNTFIQSIDEPCIVIFDEFEKIFDAESQEAILTLLDGVYPTKKLFILTVNDKYQVNHHMKNRPGRIFYLIDFKGVDQEFIREYCNDLLNDRNHIETIVRLSLIFDSFNFDMLKALVEEMNRYSETPTQALEMLNIKPSNDNSSVRHDIKVVSKGKELLANELHDKYITGSPISKDEIFIDVSLPTGKLDDEGEQITEYTTLKILSKDLKKVDPNSGTFTYMIDFGEYGNIMVIFKKEPYIQYNWHDAF